MNKNTVAQQTIKPGSTLEQALEMPCPFCGSTYLIKGLWSLGGGEVDAVECNSCFAGAPVDAWIKRE